MADKTMDMFHLVKNGKVLFGPRRYYKPAYQKACINLELQLDLPDSVDGTTELTDGYFIVHESDLASVTTVVEVEPAVIEVQVEEITDQEQTEEINPPFSRKRK